MGLTAQIESFSCGSEIVCFVQLQLPAGVKSAQAALPPLVPQVSAQEPRRDEFGIPHSRGACGVGCELLPWPLLQAVRQSHHPTGNSLGVVLRSRRNLYLHQTSLYLRDALRTTTFQKKKTHLYTSSCSTDRSAATFL